MYIQANQILYINTKKQHMYIYKAPDTTLISIEGNPIHFIDYDNQIAIIKCWQNTQSDISVLIKYTNQVT